MNVPFAHRRSEPAGVRSSPDRRVAVVVVHRNRPDSVGRTVEAYLSQPDTDRVIVVDNGSDPRGIQALDDIDSSVEVIRTAANLGFGPGANVGLRRWLRSGDGEWVAVTPHDSIPNPDTVAMILDAVQDRPDVGLVSADVGDGFRPVIDPFLGSIGATPRSESGFDLSDYPHGTFMMARRRCLEEIGLFDERYFAYCEEADLGLRAAEAGWRCGVVRGALVTNPGMSSSVELVAYLQLRNTLLMLREHFGRRNVAFRAVIAMIEIPIGMVRPCARGLHWSPRGRLKALRDHFLHRYGPPPSDIGRNRAYGRRSAKDRSVVDHGAPQLG